MQSLNTGEGDAAAWKKKNRIKLENMVDEDKMMVYVRRTCFCLFIINVVVARCQCAFRPMNVPDCLSLWDKLAPMNAAGIEILCRAVSSTVYHSRGSEEFLMPRNG